jgi:intein/homing endonuclease
VKIPDRLAEDAFWELENNPNLEVLKDCEQIASNNEQSRELYIKVRAMHFMLIEKKNSIDEARRLVKTEELWDELKKTKNGAV